MSNSSVFSRSVPTYTTTQYHVIPDHPRLIGEHPDDPGDSGLPHQAVGADARAGPHRAQPVPQRVVGRTFL